MQRKFDCCGAFPEDQLYSVNGTGLPHPPCNDTSVCMLDVLAVSDTLLLLRPFSGLFSRTTWVSRHQKGKPFWILLEQEMIGWQWHQLDHMQIICTLLQTHNYASTSPLSFHRPDALPAAQPTVSKQWMHQLAIQNVTKKLLLYSCLYLHQMQILSPPVDLI